MNINNWGLVLEGGGMRGAFTAGVLDYMMEKEIYFPYTIGVSAGSSNGVSYASRQKGRSFHSNVKLHGIRPFIGLKPLIKGKGIIDLDFLFYEYPERYYPFDYETYFNSPGRFVIVTSDCASGLAEYHEERKDKKRLVDLLRASCSLPFVCPVAMVDGRPQVDGGVCDAIPYEKAFSEGYEKLVIVLTRNKGYRKSEKPVHLLPFIYKEYPKLLEKLKDRAVRYNKKLEEIEKLEEEGKVIVIRPVKPIEVSRTEKDPNKLEALYNEGYKEAQRALESFIK
ncbi:MAG: patatin-like phospholipase family protein [Marinifilaceae bacterium]